ncbi:hypothetical protein BJ508DRAFT_358145 [Ascobolus immersus RN42]|uniref:Uncharacterized protein n=1 Tax=Ascobolus immersus RN42 TaxID=1160509 RepID=A0A3N4IXZ9_ASCIM|nr:hypothetical protein BJ508DRAFT_358145 [Ascobolus immersus RN42]
MLMNNYVDQAEPFSRRLKRNGGKLPVRPVPSAVAVVNDRISSPTASLNGGSAYSSRPASVGRHSALSVKMDYSFSHAAQQPSSPQSETEQAPSVNTNMAASLGALRSALASSTYPAYAAFKRSPSVAGHASNKFDHAASRTDTTSSNKSGIAPFPRSHASQSGVRKHSSDKSKSDPVSDVAKNFFRTNRRLKEFLTSHGALDLLPEGMVIVDKNHVSEELKNSIFDMESPCITPPAPSTDLVVVAPPDYDYDYFSEEPQISSLSIRADSLTLDSDFVYRNHNEIGRLEQPNPVSKPSLLEMDDSMLSAYGYNFARAVDQSGFTDRLYQGQGLCQGSARSRGSAFGHAQLFADDKDSRAFGFAFNAQPEEIGQGQTSLNVKAPEFTPRLTQQVPLSAARARRTNNLGNGVYFKPAQLMRTSTDPDKDWA